MTTYPASPRTDLRTAFAWIGIGAVIVIGSWRMDRLESQGAEIYTAPGLWPGIIGLLLALLGGVLAWRSLDRARESGWDAVEPDDTVLHSPRRFALAAGMFFVYALLLVGRGLPFWLGTALFVGAFVYVFRRADRLAGDGVSETSHRNDVLLAIACAAATAFVVPLVFEQLFFVRLP
ncbi:MAG: tripartite tricarboxylate transporter TctB family protein [Burkholderiales bacterium]